MLYPKIQSSLSRASPLKTRSSQSICHGRQFTLPSLTPMRLIPHKPNRKKIEHSELFHKYEKIMKEKLKYSNKIRSLKLRLQRVQKIKETYGSDFPEQISLTPTNLKKLESDAKARHQTKIFSKAVDRIESWWKKKIIKRKLEHFDFLQQKCATKIQSFWRKYIIRKRFLNTLSLLKKAVVLIQKWVRGFLARKKASLKKKELKMFQVFEYFNQQKLEIMKESARKILFFWRKFKKNQKKKLELKKKTKKKIRRKKVEENSFSAFPEAEQKIAEMSERKKLSIKLSNIKKQAGPASPAFIPGRSRAYTENLSFLEPIKEVKEVKH